MKQSILIAALLAIALAACAKKDDPATTVADTSRDVDSMVCYSGGQKIYEVQNAHIDHYSTSTVWYVYKSEKTINIISGDCIVTNN